MKTTIYYRVAFRPESVSTSWLSPDGYSKYNERCQMALDKKIQHDEVYGLEQAKEHIKEFFAKNDEYTESRRKDCAYIEKITTTTELVESYKYPFQP